MKQQSQNHAVNSIVGFVTLAGNSKTRQISDSLADASPYLLAFTIVLLLLMYGYEIFNFSLSIDEELVNDGAFWQMYIERASWANGLLTRVLPPLGNVPMIATVMFCAGLGLSAYVLARLLFDSHDQQFAFSGIFVTSPFWPHIAEFNISSWGTGIGLSLLALSLLLFYSKVRFKSVLSGLVLMIACGFVQTFAILFSIAICLRQLLVLIKAPQKNDSSFPWMIVRGALVVAGALLGYVALQLIFLKLFSLHFVHVQMYFGLPRFIHSPSETIYRVIWNTRILLNGSHASFLGYGFVFLILPALGFLILVARIFFIAPINNTQRFVALGVLAAAVALGLSLIIISGGILPIRIHYTLTPIYAFLTALAFSGPNRFRKPFYLILAATLFVSIWVSVSLFYTDHLARQRDQVLATRIMARVDQVVPNPSGRIPFVLVPAKPATSIGPFRKLEVFGDSYFDKNHERGNPYRLAAYLQILGIDTLEPHLFTETAPYRSTVDAMPEWPARGAVAMVNGMLVIKLGPTTPAWYETQP